LYFYLDSAFAVIYIFATMKLRNKEIFRFHADLCRTMASPKRLMIIALLAKKEMSVGELAEIIEVPISNISQHLRTLKDRDVVRARKEGQTVYYSLVDRRMIEACNTLREILIDKMKARGKIAGDLHAQELVSDD